MPTHVIRHIPSFIHRKICAVFIFVKTVNLMIVAYCLIKLPFTDRLYISNYNPPYPEGEDLSLPALKPAGSPCLTWLGHTASPARLQQPSRWPLNSHQGGDGPVRQFFYYSFQAFGRKRGPAGKTPAAAATAKSPAGRRPGSGTGRRRFGPCWWAHSAEAGGPSAACRDQALLLLLLASNLDDF